MHGRVAQWITRLTTDQEIPGSNPGVVVVSIFLLLVILCKMSLRYTLQYVNRMFYIINKFPIHMTFFLKYLFLIPIISTDFVSDKKPSSIWQKLRQNNGSFLQNHTFSATKDLTISFLLHSFLLFFLIIIIIYEWCQDTFYYFICIKMKL